MSSFSRLLRLSARFLFCLVFAASANAQTRPQFVQPTVQFTGGRVTSIAPGFFQSNSGLPDLLYLNGPTGSGLNTQITAGLLLDKQGFTNLNENQIVFPQVTGVVAAVGNFDTDPLLDAAFALSPTVAGGPDLCLSFGTGANVGTGISSFAGGRSGCIAFPIQGSKLPVFSCITSLPFKTGTLAQILLEDTANGALYVVTNTGAGGAGGALSGIAVKSILTIPASDGPGPILTGDFNNDGNTDFLIANQASFAATIYLGNGDGTFRIQSPVHFDHNVHSALLHDMDLDGHADLVVEADLGAIEIFHGNLDGTFGPASIGGTAAGLNGISGNGGHLVAIADATANHPAQILTATPIGISVLQAQSSLSYLVKGIYNAGPGRNSFALADFDGNGTLDLALDSPEGVAIVNGNADGGLATSMAYSAGLPALAATVGKFRTAVPSSQLDVVTSTTLLNQGQLLLGDGAGAFTAASSTTNLVPGAANPSLWSIATAGDFDGDGNRDLAFTVTGLPLPTPGPATSGLLFAYGKGDGTFSASDNISSGAIGAPADNSFFGNSVIADFNADGRDDLANLDPRYADTLLGTASRLPPVSLGLSTSYAPAGATAFNQLATGSFTTASGSHDLVLQNNADIVPYKNSGDGKTFTAMPKLAGTPDPTQLFPAAILLTDLDLDGHADIVIPYYNLAASAASPSVSTPGQLYLWFGNGDGTFSAPQVVALARNDFLAAVADMNSDGLPDILLADGALVSILYNQSTRTFSPEQHFLAGQGINSLTIADVNGDTYPDLIVANGGATVANLLALGGKSPGSTSVTLASNPDVNTGGITVLLNNAKTRPVTGSVVAAADPTNLGTAFTLTATLVPSTGVALPTGLTQFSIDGVPVGSAVSLTQGSLASAASYTIPSGNTYATGTHTLGASYSGDTANSPTVLTGMEKILGPTATTTFLALCVGPSATCPSNGVIQPPYVANLSMYYGQTFNGDASSASTDGSPLTGNINFIDTYNGVPSTICTLGVASGSTCPPTVGTTLGTSVGTNVFTAMFPGDATHAPSTSPSVTITVLQDTNAAALSATPNPSPQGQPVTFTATFTGNFAPPAGTVTFAQLFPPTTTTISLGQATLVPGPGLTSTATFTTTGLPVGTDTVSASYAATQNFAAAVATITETITPIATSTTTLTSSVNPSAAGQSVTFTASVNPIAGGTITFLDGTTTLLSVPVANGTASFTTSALTAGLHVITANYSGSPTLTPSAATLTQTVQAQGTTNFTIAVTPNPITVGVGLTAVLQVTVSEANAFAQPVTLTCANLPYESTCTFANATIPAGGGSTTLLITTMSPHGCGTTTPYFTGNNTSPTSPLPLALPALASLAALFFPGKRRWLRTLIAFAAIAAATQITTGCGTCTDLGTRPNTYTLQVSGTSTAGTPEIESQPVVLHVTI